MSVDRLAVVRKEVCARDRDHKRPLSKLDTRAAIEGPRADDRRNNPWERTVRYVEDDEADGIPD